LKHNRQEGENKSEDSFHRLSVLHMIDYLLMIILALFDFQYFIQSIKTLFPKPYLLFARCSVERATISQAHCVFAEQQGFHVLIPKASIFWCMSSAPAMLHNRSSLALEDEVAVVSASNCIAIRISFLCE